MHSGCLPKRRTAVEAVALLLYMLEISRLRALVGQTRLKRGQNNIIAICRRNLFKRSQNHTLRHVDDFTYSLPGVEAPRKVQDRFLAHTI